jgi:hypothetical protein
VSMPGVSVPRVRAASPPTASAKFSDSQEQSPREQYAVINIGGHETSGVIQFITEEQERKRIDEASAMGEI